MRFRNRREAGRLLADRLRAQDLPDPIVLALPRGGVPVGYEVAVALGAPLDVMVTRKIGAPSRPELAVGAIAEGGEPEIDVDMAHALGLGPEQLQPVIDQERAELDRRLAHYRGGRPPADLSRRTVILVDDGLATGSTARAAIRALRGQEPRRLILAVPVCPPETAERLAAEADEVIALLTPPDFRAVGLWYADFRQTGDDEVLALLEQASRIAHAGRSR